MVRVDYRNGAVSVSGSDGVGADIEYQRNSAGEVYLAAQGGSPIALDRNWRGDVVAIREGSRSVRFVRDHLGQVVETWRSDGDIARYLHDALGFRTRLEHGRGGTVRLAYDAAGNIVEMESVPAAGPDGARDCQLERSDVLGSTSLGCIGRMWCKRDGLSEGALVDIAKNEVLATFTPQALPESRSEVLSTRVVAPASHASESQGVHVPPVGTFGIVGCDPRPRPTRVPRLRRPWRKQALSRRGLIAHVSERDSDVRFSVRPRST